MIKNKESRFLCLSTLKKLIIIDSETNNHFFMLTKETEGSIFHPSFVMKQVFLKTLPKISLRWEIFKIIKSHQLKRDVKRLWSLLPSLLMMKLSSNGRSHLTKKCSRSRVLQNLVNLLSLRHRKEEILSSETLLISK